MFAHHHERPSVPAPMHQLDLEEVIDLNNVESLGSICARAEGLREMREITVDSGAGEPVINPEHLPGTDVNPSSRPGKRYVGPGEEIIPNLSEMNAGILTENGVMANMKFQGAPVRKPWLVVSLAAKGNITIFDDEGSIIIPKNSKLLRQIRKLVRETDKKIPLHE